MDPFDDSFAFLRPKNYESLNESNASGRELLWEVFGKKQEINTAVANVQSKLPEDAKVENLLNN